MSGWYDIENGNMNEKYIRYISNELKKEKDHYYINNIDNDDTHELLKHFLKIADEVNLKNSESETRIKCKVDGCENHNDQGVFEGEVCKPCYLFLKDMDEYIKTRSRQYRCSALNLMKLLVNDYMG